MKLIFCLQINTKALSDEVDFFYLPKYKSLIQINIMILMGMTMHSYSFQNTKFEMSLHYLNKEFRGKVNFCMQMNKVSYKFISTLWTSNFPTRWCHHWWKCSNILKVVKITCLQYLHNISKKKFWFLHAHKHQKFLQVGVIVFSGSGQTCLKYPK